MEPKTVREVERSYLFGWVAFFYVLEDRRPDLTEEQAKATLGYKYKLLVTVRLFGFKASVVTHTLTPGLLFVNEREVE